MNLDVEALLFIIRDMIHNKKEWAQSTIGLVESNVALSTTTMDPKDTLGDYYKVFKAQLDTIEAHS